jgi:hypothetical protein
VAAAVLVTLGLGIVGLERLERGADSPQARAEARRTRDVPATESTDLVATPGHRAIETEPGRGVSPGSPALAPLPPPPPGCIIGRITCADGKPAAGAKVWTEGSDDRAVVFARRETEAGADGIYRFEGLSAGMYRVGASHEGHASSDEHGPSYGVGPGWGREVSIRLRVGGTLKVVVRHIAGSPVQGAEVEVLRGIVIRDGQEPIARALTNERGEAVLEHLPGGESVRVRAEGRQGLRTCVMVFDRCFTVVDLVVGAVLEGSVALEDGTLVEDGTVQWFGPMAAGATRSEAGIDGTGRFAVWWLAPGEYEVTVQGPGISSGSQTIRVGPEPAVTIPLRLGRPAVLGRVKHEHLSKVRVRLDSSDTGRGLSMAVGTDGGFAFYDVRPGRYLLTASADGTESEALLQVVVEPGERVAGIELTLRPRAYGEVELEILDANGAFSGRVQLYLDGTSIAPPPLGGGRYRFRAAAGRRSVTAQWANGSRSTAVYVIVEGGETAYATVRLPE